MTACKPVPYPTRLIASSATLISALALVLAASLPAPAATDGPIVIETSPVGGAQNVSTSSNIVVRFDRQMNLSTIVPTTILVNGQPLSSDEHASVTFPTEEADTAIILMPMGPSTAYQITLPTSITDSQGRALDQPYTWAFTTSSRVDVLKEPMRSFARYPRMNEWDIPTNAPITVTFTGEVDETSINAHSLQVRSTSGGDPVPGQLSVQGTRLVFRPDSTLKPNHPYEAVVAAGIRSTWGVASERAVSWQFNTAEGPAEGPIVTDAWYEIYSDSGGRRMVLHAAVDNLVRPGERKATKSSSANEVAPGYALRATVVPVEAVQPLTGPAALPVEPGTVTEQDEQARPGTQVVVAAYENGGGRGQGNSARGGSKDSEREKTQAAIKSALATESAVLLWDSGDTVAHGDVTKGDGVYSARLVLANNVPSGPGLASFAIVAPDGQITEPATVPFFILPTAEEQRRLEK